MNSYCDLNTLKSRLAIENTDSDTMLRLVLEAASRALDNHLGRYFYVEDTTKYYHGAETILFLDDLLSVNTFKVDAGGDGVYEVEFETTDYILKPLNKYPKTRAEINPNGSYSSFASDIPKGVQIVGSWGCAHSETPYTDSGAVVNTGGITDSTLSHALATGKGALFSAGQTILIDSEQLYILSISTDTLTFLGNPTRGQNGTAAAAHVAGKKIYIYNYPEAIREACLIMAARLWKRKDTGYGTTIGAPEIGTVEVFHGLDHDVKYLIAPYRRVSI